MASFLWGANGEEVTPEEIAQRREMAQALLQRGQETPAYNWAQGAANIMNSFMGGFMQGRAMKAERANDDYNKAMVAALSGDGAFGGSGTDASDPQVNSYLGSDEAMKLAAPQDQSDPFAGVGTDAASPVTRDVGAPSSISPVARALIAPTRPTVGQAAQAGATDLITQHFLDHMRQAESGGDASATNPNSSATGDFQFTNPTWTGLMRQHPELGLTADGRTDPAQSQAAAKQLATDNLAYMLAHGVQNPTEGQAYLAHFAGAPTATNLVQADPNTPVSQIMSQQQIAANPFLRNMTAGQAQDWAAQKMGGPGTPPSAAQQPQLPGNSYAPSAGYSGQYPDMGAPQVESGPSMSALLGVLADPRANQQTRGVASALLQNQLQLQQVQQRYQMEQADPENVARRRYYDAETQRLMNQPQKQGAEYRLLSSQEKQQLGLPAGGNYQMDATGKVSAIGGGGVNVLPSAPAGYYYQPGPDGQATLQPVPGGPVDQAKNTQADQARTTSDVIGRTGHDLLSAIDQSPNSTTGAGGMALSYLPTSQAAQVQRLDNVLSAMGSIEAVSAMRQASPTGGALGSLTEKEEALLKSKQGALDPRAGYDTYRKNALDYIHTVYRLVNGGEAGDRLYGTFLDGLGGNAQQPGQSAPQAGARTTSSGVTWSVR
ncbi:MAG: hypothetical protein ABF636_10355 [Acetobacter sp.]|uniref:hypothetical protein n=1 Tax=Acetobacter sp. TaxID=440 RepID=UPI0039EB8862